MAAGDPVLYSLYVYVPNKWAPIFFTTIYGISAAFHIWQCYRYKAFKLVGLHAVCGVMFTVGYALRAYGSHHYMYDSDSKVPLMVFIMTQVFVYCCPPLLELANYHVLGRVFYYVPYCTPFPPNKVLATFGGIMILIETLNALGVSLSANPSSSHTTQTMGEYMSIVAIALQIVVILIFSYLAGTFHQRCIKANIHARNVKSVLLTLYGSMFLIFARCIYRLVEHTGNTDVDIDNLEALRELSPILRYEAFFYIFEATLMFINSVLWNVWHPGRLLPRDYHVYLGRDGIEVVGEEDTDERALLAKTAHVLTFGLLFRRKRKSQNTQELGDYSNIGS
jgi:hypothetical protein